MIKRYEDEIVHTIQIYLIETELKCIKGHRDCTNFEIKLSLSVSNL